MNRSLVYQPYTFINLSQVETFTTPYDIGHSYQDNSNNTNVYNVDNLMKVNL